MKTKLKTTLLLLGTCVVSITLSGCNPIAALENRFISDADAKENPLFWDTAISVEGTTNLYELRSNAFMDRPVSAIAQYGDDILMIERAIYTDFLDMPSEEGDDEDGWEDADWSDDNYDDGFESGNQDVQLSFSLYSPWRDSTIGTIEYTDIDYDDYVVLDDARLFLYSYEKNTFALYDSLLNLIGTYQLDGLNESISPYVFCSSDPNVLYSYTYSGNQIVKITLPDDSTNKSKKASKDEVLHATSKLIAPSLLNFTIVQKQKNSNRYICSGITKDSYREVMTSYDLETGEYDILIDHCSYTVGDYNADGFVAQTNMYHSFWEIQNSDSTSYYFADDSIYHMTLFDDGSFLAQSNIYGNNTDDSTITLQCAHYEKDGTVSSGFSYDNGNTSSEESYYPSSNAIIFEEDNLVFVLEYSISQPPYLLVWDLSKPGEFGESLELTEDAQALEDRSMYLDALHNPEYSYPNTLVLEPEQYDFGELTEARAYADTLEEKYGISIYIGDEVPERFDIYQIEKCLDFDAVMQSLNAIDDVLSQYPDGFFTQLQYSSYNALRLYLAGNISASDGDGLQEAGAFVTTNVQSYVMVIDAREYDLCMTINHELSHIIDSRLEYVSLWNPDATDYSSENWLALNPPEFSYAYSYTAYDEGEITYEGYDSYFISSYGMTYPTEDRAEIFADAASFGYSEDYDYLKSWFSDHIRLKIKFYANSIRECFDTTGWPSVTCWEKIINSY